MLLPVLSRIIAKLVATQLQTWAESQGLLRQSQWGLRPNRRCAGLALVLTLLLEMPNRRSKAEAPEWGSLVLVLLLSGIWRGNYFISWEFRKHCFGFFLVYMITRNM